MMQRKGILEMQMPIITLAYMHTNAHIAMQKNMTGEKPIINQMGKIRQSKQHQKKDKKSAKSLDPRRVIGTSP